MDSDLHIISFALLFARWWMWVNKSDPGVCRTTTTHFVVLFSLWRTVKSGNLWCRTNLFIRIFHFFTLAHSSGNRQREDFHVERELKRQIETKQKNKKKSLSTGEMLLKVRMCLLLFTWAVLHSWRRRERKEGSDDAELFWINNVIFMAASSKMNNNVSYNARRTGETLRCSKGGSTWIVSSRRRRRSLCSILEEVCAPPWR